MTDANDTVQIECPTCVVCGKASVMEVPLAGYRKWEAGAYVQDAFPEIPAPKRELLVSGTHPDCWKLLWKDE